MGSQEFLSKVAKGFNDALGGHSAQGSTDETCPTCGQAKQAADNDAESAGAKSPRPNAGRSVGSIIGYPGAE